jgi:hypothetical protein
MFERPTFVHRFLRAMIGLRPGPSEGNTLVVTLIENGSVENLAMGAWTLPRARA